MSDTTLLLIGKIAEILVGALFGFYILVWILDTSYSQYEKYLKK